MESQLLETLKSRQRLTRYKREHAVQGEIDKEPYAEVEEVPVALKEVSSKAVPEAEDEVEVEAVSDHSAVLVLVVEDLVSTHPVESC
jgi:hypothetical protein